MSVVHQIGPRSALLLGLLQGGPKTAGELLDLIEKALAVRGFQTSTIRTAAQGLADDGLAALVASLERMRDDHSMVESIPDPEGGELWLVLQQSQPASSG